MDSKARSRPMANILERLQATGRYTVVFFGEKTILDESIEKWPACDFLIAFFSKGFPLEKALQYWRERRPFSVNSLVRQFLLLDRRVVLQMLRHIGVATPAHVVASRDGGPWIHPALQQAVERRMGLRLGGTDAADVEELDADTLRVGTQVIHKPFVEKPCDSEDHNIYIYYASAQGGGVRRLFRKTGNKSSEFVPGPAHVRTDGSFIYEEFVDVDNAEDVKVYTVGQRYAHAEVRKSPVVDGRVRRDSAGKEMRFVTALTDAERECARAVCKAFGQRVCGFDILRAAGRSLVMDVNGWSFVKGSETYYDDAARILDARFQKALHHRWVARFVDPDAVGRASECRWALKAVLAVCRHADRTPKQKSKCVLRSSSVVALLGNASAEIVLRSASELRRTLDALLEARRNPHIADPLPTIDHLADVLARKIDMPGTKVQLKPLNITVMLVLKWGGECTHAGLAQSLDLGEIMRKDLLLINSSLLDDVRIFSSSERRVLSTVGAYASAFLGQSAAEVMPRVRVRPDMLDDSSAAAKNEMEVAKQQMRDFFNFCGPLSANPFCSPGLQLPAEMGDCPRTFLREMCNIISRLIARMEQNFAELSCVDALQPEWCCGETPDLFRERWKKILRDFRLVDGDQVVYDPAKVGELYDSLKYDALHNRPFLERIFMPTHDLQRDLQEHRVAPAHGLPEYPPDPLFAQQDVRDLYYRAKQLFDFVTRREYGIEPPQRKKIGILASVPLLRQLIADLNAVRCEDGARTCFYFTKESHIHTLLNLIFLCHMPTMVPYEHVGELDYLTHIIFEVYERKPDVDADLEREYSVRIGFSPGANCFHILDTNIDATHALKVLPRRNFTYHMPLD
ncbi:hypothetical protein COEREDRAFT_63026, partial [Coemansia reversa NRRL 1564]